MKRFLIWGGIAVLVLFLAVLAVPLLIDANQFRPELERRLSAALERPVTIGDLSVALFSGGVAIRDVTVAGDPGALEPLLRAKSITAGVDMRELIFSRRLMVRSIDIDEPEIVLVDSVETKPTPAPLAEPAPAEPTANSAPLNLSIQEIQISDGRISLTTNSGANPIKLDDVNLNVRNFGANSSFPITLDAHVASGGDIHMEGQAGPVTPDHIGESPFDAKLKVTDLDLSASGFFEPEAGIAGILSLDGTAASDSRNIETTAKVSVKNFKAAKNGKPADRPAEADLSVKHDNSTRKGTIQDNKIRLGSAQATLNGSYDLSGREPVINLRLQGSKMPLTELASFLPALDVELPRGSKIESGTADIDIATKGPLGRLSTTAAVRADKARLGSFDLGSKMKVIAQLAGLSANPGTDIDLLTTNVTTTPEGTIVEGIKLVVPGIGELTGKGTISPQHALDMKMLATLATKGTVREVLGQNVPFLVQGTTADPSFKADLKGVAGQKIQQAIKNPEGAVKTVNKIIDMFKRAPKATEVKK